MKKLFASFVLLMAVVVPVALLTACGARVVHVDGFYVRHVLFGFDEEIGQQILDGELCRYDVARELVVDGRPFWGEGGVYQEMQAALDGLSGQAALDMFEDFLQRYNTDPGMFDPDWAGGYFIPLGRSVMVWEFELLVRGLLDSENPEGSIGNAFLSWGYCIDGQLTFDRHLGFTVTNFGVHVAIVVGVSVR